MGGYCFWEAAYHELAGKPVYLDTSSASAFMPPPLMKAIIDRHGTERILMGSDYPLTSPGEELARLLKIPWLTFAQREAICGGNAARLLGLTL
jgi:predicted TIM-barrel fold metal-dependent hydrolase